MRITERHLRRHIKMRVTKNELKRIIEQAVKSPVPKDIQDRIKNISDPADREALKDAVEEVWVGGLDITDLEDMLDAAESGGGAEMMESAEIPGEKSPYLAYGSPELEAAQENLQMALINVLATEGLDLLPDDWEDAWSYAKDYVQDTWRG